MNIELSTAYPLTIILIMTIVTLVTRWGGVFIMSYVPISDTVQRFITAMSGSVLVALLAPIAVEGDNGARLALGSTLLVMLFVKKPLVAIAAGIISAALFRHYFS